MSFVCNSVHWSLQKQLSAEFIIIFPHLCHYHGMVHSHFEHGINSKYRTTNVMKWTIKGNGKVRSFIFKIPRGTIRPITTINNHKNAVNTTIYYIVQSFVFQFNKTIIRLGIKNYTSKKLNVKLNIIHVRLLMAISTMDCHLLTLYVRTGKLSQYLNALHSQMGKLSCNTRHFLKFSAFIITNLFFYHICLKGLYRQKRLCKI
jgi:hypothetical protein